jgi:acyl-CoA synthetase (AMP-forming)/AMP-acid ligase II
MSEALPAQEILTVPYAMEQSTAVVSLRRWARTQPEAVALRFRESAWTWAELLARVRKLAGALDGEGVVPGDRIAFLDKNHPAGIELALAAAWVGAVTVPVNYRLAEPEIAYVLDDAGAKLVLAGEAFAEAAKAGQRQVICVGEQYEALLYNSTAAGQPHPAGADDAFLQMYTSGTTGFPKGAVLTHRNLAAHSAALSSRVGIDRESVNLAPMPLYHVGGMAWALQAPHSGATLILMPDAAPAALMNIVEQFRVTHAFVVPTVLAALLRLPDLADADLGSLRGLTYGAAPMPRPLLQRVLSALDTDFYQVYGATEISGAATALGAEDHRAPIDDRHLESAGRPLPGVELAIADPETGDHLPAGAVGEVRLRGEQVMSEYWRRPEDTREAVPDGWLRTGDAGYVDDHGYLFIVDRIKDMIISGGENIYPAEVERVLGDHPGVAEVAVIGVADEKWGETPKALVVPAADPPDLAELLAFCRARLASYKLPKSFEFVAELPRNGAGKVLKRDLRAKFAPATRIG